MKLITGGFSQGKVRYAQKQYHIPEEETVDAGFATVAELEEAGLIYNLQEYIRSHHTGTECNLPSFRQDAVIICDEIGCGIVPLSREERLFREVVGRICCRLAEQADSVEVVRCGIARRIK